MLWIDLAEAGNHDDITMTTDYSVLERRIVETVGSSSFSLIESVAELVARICLENPRVHRVEVTVQKPHALSHTRTVEVTICRTRRQVHDQ